MPLKIFFFFLSLFFFTQIAFADPNWVKAWPNTDIENSRVDISEIISGGPPRDGIPPIDLPLFDDVANIDNIAPREPVITVEIKDTARAYPIRILMWHEIVNDRIGRTAFSVTYCPLCNASMVFDRYVDGKLLDFGTSGLLRHSDMIMYDRQSETLWQQFTGEAIVGARLGTQLKPIPSRIESFEKFKKRHPNGQVLIPNNPDMRDYGRNPYVNYDTSRSPFLYMGQYDEDIPPMARLVAVGNQAWPLKSVRKVGIIEAGDLKIAWTAGQHSALDRSKIRHSRDIGNITVTRNGQDVVHHIPFAFAFKAFHPDGVIH